MRGRIWSRRHHKHRRSTANSHYEEEPHSALSMEGMLKKRLAKMPVMHDRYCVATWELDDRDRKCIMLRSYKSRKAYNEQPEKPTSVHQVKCISDWDGKTGFHRYQHAFTVETRDRKLFQCIAPSAAEKGKWIEFIAIPSAVQSGERMGAGCLVPLRRSQSAESVVDSGKAQSNTNKLIFKKGHDGIADATHSSDSEDQLDSNRHDKLHRSASGASSNTWELLTADKNEPADWGLYGEDEGAGEGKSKYEVPDNAKPVLLENDLLDTRREPKTLASDLFLFDDAGSSRFGAVVVKEAVENNDNEDDEFIDEKFAALEAQKENEKKLKRRAQKLETNRDRYAEMAAVRLANMRKDARTPAKYNSHSRLSAESVKSDAELVTNDQALFDDGHEIGALNDMGGRRSTQSRRSYASHVSSSTSHRRGNIEDESGFTKESDDIEDAVNAHASDTEILAVDELNLRRKKSRAEWRAKKRLLKEQEDEDRTAFAAAELARAHREEQRNREEAKSREEQKKRDKKHRREVKEKLKHEKAKQRQAEAEFQKLMELKQAEEERREQKKRERKEMKKKKRKEKYTSPAERIQKKDQRVAEQAAELGNEVSRALVVVEKPTEAKLDHEKLAAPKSVLTSNSTVVHTEASGMQHAATTQVANPIAASISAPALSSTTQSAGQGMPTHEMIPSAFVNTNSTGPQSLPAYGFAATFGAYHPIYSFPYSYGGPMGLQPLFTRPPSLSFVNGLGAVGMYEKAVDPELAPKNLHSAQTMIGPQLPPMQERAFASSSGNSVNSSLRPPVGEAKLCNLSELPDVVEF